VDNKYAAAAATEISSKMFMDEDNTTVQKTSLQAC
jgi:nitrate reductase cytochrome c-type subunit